MNWTPETWQAICAAATIFLGAVGWGFKLIRERFAAIETTMTNQHNERSRQHEMHKDVVAKEFAGMRQKDAELSNNISQLRLEVTKEQQTFVTRAELDRRIERLEDETRTQTTKLDEIIRRLP